MREDEPAGYPVRDRINQYSTSTECPNGVPCLDSDGNGIVDYLDGGAAITDNWIWLPIVNAFSQ